MRRGLAFSGGKDSWACLWMYADQLKDIHVIWVNTGKNIPEVLAMVEKARSMCPLFVEVKADREAQNAAFGLPSDLVPVNFTILGQAVKERTEVTVQSYLDCCYSNISAPLLRAAQNLQLDELIVGQRSADGHRGTRKDGDKVNGVTYRHPIEGWTDSQVMLYLDGLMALPEHFKLQHTSVDCYDCTAYRKETVDKREYIAAKHPMLHAEYTARNNLLNKAVRAAWEL